MTGTGDDNDGVFFGASAEDWERFLALGLTADLLPVLSRPGIAIAPGSKLEPGKYQRVPSLLNGSSLAIGIAGWSRKRTTPGQVAAWRKNADYGIGIQTRELRAVDIDIEDEALAQRAEDAVCAALGQPPGGVPVRYRWNSAKRLMVVFCRGEYRKRIMRPPGGGLVELLVNGQQFVAAGTHPSGSRYDWRGWRGMTREDCGVPVIPPGGLDTLWAALAEALGVPPPGGASAGLEGAAGREERVAAWYARKGGALGQGSVDGVAERLHAAGRVLDIGRDGQLYIECPWKELHTSDSGVTECCYMPGNTGTAGRGLYGRGHFKCFHASCAERTDGDFENALGLVLNDFGIELPQQRRAPGGNIEEVVEKAALKAALRGVDSSPTRRPPAVVCSRGLRRTGALLPPLVRHTSGRGQGLPVNSFSNYTAYIGSFHVSGIEFRFDDFRANVVYREEEGGPLDWKPLTDDRFAQLCCLMESVGFTDIRGGVLRECVRYVARENSFDSAAAWMRSLSWDGRPRVRQFFQRAFGVRPAGVVVEAPDGSLQDITPQTDPYTESMSEYFWTALAARVADPGCKADMVPIICGSQGQRKSWGLSRLVPKEDWFKSVALDTRDENLGRLMAGTVLFELGEMRGLASREIESIKDFISKRWDSWIPKYVECQHRQPRRTMFVGTSNYHDILSDETGNRRFGPLSGGRVDLDYIDDNRDQLWAEGYALYICGGVAWEAAEVLAKVELPNYTLVNTVEDQLVRWLHAEQGLGGVEGKPIARDALSNEDIVLEAFGYSRAEFARGGPIMNGLLRKTGLVLRSAGYQPGWVSRGSTKTRGWVRNRTGRALMLQDGRLILPGDKREFPAQGSRLKA